MAISVDSSYYYDVYMGKEYDDIDHCLKRAADIIDGMIIMPITTEPQLEAYKNAVCAEAEYIANCGGTSDINEGKGAASFSLGKDGLLRRDISLAARMIDSRVSCS